MQGWKGGQCTWSTMSSTAKMLGPRLFYDFKKCYTVDNLCSALVHQALAF